MIPVTKRVAFLLLIFCAFLFTGSCVSEPQKTIIKPSVVNVEPLKTWKEPVTGMEFVWVPGGCYEMGCGSWTSNCLKQELPVHEVCVDGFWLGRHEVTQGQYKQLLGRNTAHFNMGDAYPMESVTVPEVKIFIDKLAALNNGRYSYRLPSEAEWEYAARSGGKPEKFAGGNEPMPLAWFQATSRTQTHPVGTKISNGLGIHDMSGNVWEWCRDKYDSRAYGKHQKNNPVITESESTHQVIRSGGWDSPSRFVRCSQRLEYAPNMRNRNIGFRLVMEGIP